MKIIYSIHYKSYIAIPESPKEEAVLVERKAGELLAPIHDKSKLGTKNNWKGKHHRDCPHCGQMFVNLGKHISAMHTSV